MLVVSATIGVIALSAISDTIRKWKTLDKEGKIGGCVMVALLILAAITTAALATSSTSPWASTRMLCARIWSGV